MIGGKNTWNSGSFVLLGAVLISVLMLYFPFLKSLIADWSVNEDYSHGYFIPFLSAYFIYTMRKELSELQVQPSNWGLILLLLGFAQLLIGKVGSEYFLQRTSFILVILGLIWFFLGWEFFKKLLFPILYLLFMVPLPAIIWNKIAFPMQLFASAITENVVYAIGIPIYREGNVLHLAETTLEVVAACSGLRSLMTMFALSGTLAFLSIMSTSRKWILFISAAPIAIVANILRLTGTAVLASQFGSEVAHGFLHDFSGIVVFILGLAMLLGVNSLLSRVAFER
jgi:exosortase